MTVIAAATAALLVVFSARRIVLLGASLVSGLEAPAPGGPTPRVTVAVPAHNERRHADRFLAALERLDYPRDRLAFALVCDGCTDGTEERFRTWARDRRDTTVVVLRDWAGKAAALDAALSHSHSAIVVTLDADLVPRPDVVRRLVAALADPSVGGAAALIKPENGDANVVARYSTLNTLVHQLVTSAGKDRLGLNPPTNGASAYRRSALQEIGGFPSEAPGEDVATTVALTRAGWKTRFVASSVAETAVPETIRQYWAQHVRWTRNTLDARGPRQSDRRLPAFTRLEEWLLSIGNGDRIVFLAAVAVAVAGPLPLWAPVAYLAVPALQATVAVLRTAGPARLPAFAAAGLLMVPLDVAASVTAVLGVARARSRGWDTSRRPGVADRPSP